MNNTDTDTENAIATIQSRIDHGDIRIDNDWYFFVIRHDAFQDIINPKYIQFLIETKAYKNMDWYKAMSWYKRMLFPFISRRFMLMELLYEQLYTLMINVRTYIRVRMNRDIKDTDTLKFTIVDDNADNLLSWGEQIGRLVKIRNFANTENAQK